MLRSLTRVSDDHGFSLCHIIYSCCVLAGNLPCALHCTDRSVELVVLVALCCGAGCGAGWKGWLLSSCSILQHHRLLACPVCHCNPSSTFTYSMHHYLHSIPHRDLGHGYYFSIFNPDCCHLSLHTNDNVSDMLCHAGLPLLANFNTHEVSLTQCQVHTCINSLHPSLLSHN